MTRRRVEPEPKSPPAGVDPPLRLEYRTPAELAENPANWRQHGEAQVTALNDLIGEVGWAGAVLFNEQTGRLIDGHARRKVPGELLVDGKVPVLIGRWTEEQELLILASLDPLAGMATTDSEKLAELLGAVTTDSTALNAMFDGLTEDEGGSTDKDKRLEDLQPNYAVFVNCENEGDQKSILMELERHGLDARALFIGLPPPVERQESAPLELEPGEKLITRSTAITRSARVKQAEGIFDIAPAKKSEHTWRVKLDLDAKPWNLGLIVGPSGSGKSTIAREFFGDRIIESWPWPEQGSLLDGFPEAMSVHDIVGLLSSVGFSSPPGWLKPYHVLSNGEKFRVHLARTLAEDPELAVVDEYSSVVDRTVAQIGSAALAKTVRKRGGRFIALSCHYDVEEWLQPDWRYDLQSGEFAWRSLRRRPDVQISIRRSDSSTWPIFRQHHYLSANLHRQAQCYVATVGGRPAAFVAVLHTPGKHGGVKRESRCVCLPDFQGVGIGNAVSEFVASLYSWKWRYHSVTSHPAMIAHRVRSPLWRMVREPSRVSAQPTNLAWTTSWDRITATFAYVGSGRQEEAKGFGIS